MADIRRKPFFYDRQLARAILQVMACFCGYQVMSGKQRDGKHRFTDVPVIFANYSRTAAHILSGGSDNVVSAVPIISVEMTELKQSNDLRRVPQYAETIYWSERTDQTDDEELGTENTGSKMGERYIPVPYEARFKVSIWASNNDQAFQLIEQIGQVFNPELDLMMSNSPADWTFLSYIKFEGTFEPTSVAADIGAGTEDKFNVWNAEFKTIIQMSPPMKVQAAAVVETIHTNILNINKAVDFDTMDLIDGFVISANS